MDLNSRFKEIACEEFEDEDEMVGEASPEMAAEKNHLTFDRFIPTVR
jgi:hypothetical protein